MKSYSEKTGRVEKAGKKSPINSYLTHKLAKLSILINKQDVIQQSGRFMHI